jgi:hypothetical protein
MTITPGQILTSEELGKSDWSYFKYLPIIEGQDKEFVIIHIQTPGAFRKMVAFLYHFKYVPPEYTPDYYSQYGARVVETRYKVLWMGDAIVAPNALPAFKHLLTIKDSYLVAQQAVDYLTS